MIDLLLEKEDPNIPNIDGWTPLHKAAKAGAVDVVAKLLERHANPNVADKKGRTPLHIAAFNGHGAVIKLLLQYGADICAKDYRRRTPYALATGDAKRELELMIEEKGFYKLLKFFLYLDPFFFIMRAVMLSLLPFSIAYVTSLSTILFSSSSSVIICHIS